MKVYQAGNWVLLKGDGSKKDKGALADVIKLVGGGIHIRRNPKKKGAPNGEGAPTGQ